MTSIEVRPLTATDWPAVARIYAAGIATGHATFEENPPSWEAFDASKLKDQRLVAVEAGAVIGWAAASTVSDRCVYAGVVEHSVYVDPHHQGRGIGQALLQGLIISTETAGIWTIQSGIFPENTASLTAHQKAGFNVVGTRAAIGQMTYGPMAGAWRDVLFIERRSQRVGTPHT
jgi:L-amino acid N-acyltransferase YncA